MSFVYSLYDDSFSMKENCDEFIITRQTSSNIESSDLFTECPTLWPSLTYNQCGSDTDKEIWITMFDEETTMDLFPTPSVAPLSPLLMKQKNTDHHKSINFATASITLSAQRLKRKHSDDCTNSPPRKRSTKMPSTNNDKPLVLETIQNFSFKNFSWQAIQSDNCQPIQQSVIRRLNL